MICHVLPGDAQFKEFQEAGIPGQVIVCREALVSGPIDAPALDEFWAQRASYVLAEFGDDEIVYHERVADPLNSLTELGPEDEINLWFEYELFCSVNLWFCLSLVEFTGAAVYRVEPIGLKEENRWNGFTGFTSDDLLASFELRSRLSDTDVKLGADLWRAYSRNDHQRLTSLADGASFSFPCIGEVAAAAAEQDIRPKEILKEIIAHGSSDLARVFAEFKKRAGVYGYGDVQVQKLIDQLDQLSS